MSKELTALEKIKNKEILIDIEMTNTFYNEYDDLHNSFDAVEKSLQALEIIKEKVSDIKWLKYCISLGSLEQYNAGGVPSYEQLTQEEYELLKEVLL